MSVVSRLVRRTIFWFLLLLASAGSAAAEPVAGADAAGAAPLTLAAALARTLQNNPELAMATDEIRAREAEALQAGLRPNPLLALEAENVLGSGAFSGTGAAETTLSISQTIELGEKRARRRAVAEAEVALAQNDLLLARADALARTTESFLAVLAGQERLYLAEELATIAGQLLSHVEERVAAGKAAATESARARIQWRELEVAEEKVRRNLAAARHALAAAMGVDAGDFGAAAGDLARLGDAPELAELERQLERSPRLARQTGDIERRQRDVELETARRIPDLEIGLGARYLRESEDTALVAGVSMPLPVFDRNQGAVAAARHRLAQARADERKARVQAKAALRSAWQQMAAAGAEAQVLGSEIVPAARQALQAAEYGYRAGKFGILDVLDAQRMLIEVRGRYLDALTAYHRASIEVHRMSGQLPAAWESTPASDSTRSDLP